jgi:fructan beta-fructosidase
VSEKFRPALHLTPPVGWMNDPNGLIVVDGIYHAFFQHDPHSTNHGPMHWGHATSTDLAHWTAQPVALYPTNLGTCFSGSAIETETGDIRLFYTAHSKTSDGADHQVQCLVHADRKLAKFSSDPGNPIVSNPGRIAFRDPKVIWHAPTVRWIMLVTEGQSIGFYASTDLVRWSHLSSFGEGHGRHSEGPWECPDLVCLSAPDGTPVWVLIVGLNPGGYAPGSGTQYFIGHFDGTRFTNANPAEAELWLDYGRDYYAAQTFFDRRGNGAPVAMAWASNWLYARSAPTGPFRGALSLPRELHLDGTGKGLRVAASVPKQVSEQFDHFRLGDTPLVPRTGTYRLTGTIRLQRRQASRIALFGESHPQLSFERAADGQVSLRLVRTAIDEICGFAHDYAVPIGDLNEFEVEIFVDNGLVEVSADRGTVWATNLHFPDAPAGRVSLVSSVMRTTEASVLP